jgi:hypothetical protein
MSVSLVFLDIDATLAEAIVEIEWRKFRHADHPKRYPASDSSYFLVFDMCLMA